MPHHNTSGRAGGHMLRDAASLLWPGPMAAWRMHRMETLPGYSRQGGATVTAAATGVRKSGSCSSSSGLGPAQNRALRSGGNGSGAGPDSDTRHLSGASQADEAHQHNPPLPHLPFFLLTYRFARVV